MNSDGSSSASIASRTCRSSASGSDASSLVRLFGGANSAALAFNSIV
jgi:hypothetical protein